jgi:hypothetical protein
MKYNKNIIKADNQQERNSLVKSMAGLKKYFMNLATIYITKEAPPQKAKIHNIQIRAPIF